MSYYGNIQYQQLPYVDFRPRFFIESALELLNVQVPHFHHARLMNSFSVCRELISYINDYLREPASSAYIDMAIDEFETTSKRDLKILPEIAMDVELLLEQLKRVRKGDLSRGLLISIKLQTQGVHNYFSEFEEAVFDRLHEVIHEPTDITKKGRITESIYGLTSSYLTVLMNRGYYPRYLFSRIMQLADPARNRKTPFSSILNEERARLGRTDIDFEVYFRVSVGSNVSLTVPTGFPAVAFLQTGWPVQVETNLKKVYGKDFSGTAIARVGVQATDYLNAAWKSKAELDTVLDILLGLEVNPNLAPIEHCVTMSQHNALVHPHLVDLDKQTNFIASESGTNLSVSQEKIAVVIDRLKPESRDCLYRSLRYLSLARTVSSIDQKILNLWIALETLFGEFEGTVIGPIIAAVPEFYAASTSRRRLQYLLDLLVSEEIPIPYRLGYLDLSSTQIFDASSGAPCLFNLLLGYNTTKVLFDSLGDNEHLKFRLLHTHKLFSDVQAFLTKNKDSISDVGRHIRRIYYIRNKIVHDADHSGTNSQILSHLFDYLSVCYSVIVQSLSHKTSPGEATLQEVFYAYLNSIRKCHRNLNAGIRSYDDVIPRPNW